MFEVYLYGLCLLHEHTGRQGVGMRVELLEQSAAEENSSEEMRYVQRECELCAVLSGRWRRPVPVFTVVEENS
jgi:hypothetical protein